MKRRDFTRLTATAFGGLITGSFVGCGGGADDAGDAQPSGETAADEHDVSLLMEEPHVCRGLNTCQGHGKGGENACAGRGACATAEKHACAGENACKGQGGCGQHPGQNTCQGKGECAVPLSEDVWKVARAAFEEQMQQAGKEVGEPPAG